LIGTKHCGIENDGKKHIGYLIAYEGRAFIVSKINALKDKVHSDYIVFDSTAFEVDPSSVEVVIR